MTNFHVRWGGQSDGLGRAHQRSHIRSGGLYALLDEKTAAEMSFRVLAYNIKRMISSAFSRS